MAYDPFTAFDLYSTVRIEDSEIKLVVPKDGIQGWERVTEWDIKKGKGTKGANYTVSQLPPAEGTIKFLLYQSKDWAEWERVAKIFKFDPTKKAKQALDIWHPILEAQGVKSVVCKSIGAPIHEENHLWSVTVSLVEWEPPPKKSVVFTPGGSGTTPGKSRLGASSEPLDPVEEAKQAEIKKLREEAQGL